MHTDLDFRDDGSTPPDIINPAPPTIDPVDVSDTVVTGTSEPGAEIILTIDNPTA